MCFFFFVKFKGNHTQTRLIKILSDRVGKQVSLGRAGISEGDRGCMVTSFAVKSVATFISKEKRLGRFRDFVSLSSMESLTENKIYFHYNHTDSCNSARWTARESYQFMYERPWQDVLHFFSNVVNARLTLSTLFGTDNSPQVSICFFPIELTHYPINLGRVTCILFNKGF